MSTNATLRNNLTKRGTTNLCGNIVNKEKDLLNPNNKKTTVINQAVFNGKNSNWNSNGDSINNVNNKTNNFSKVENCKIKIKPKENNENDKNANNISLKRKLTMDVENLKKSTNNNSFINNNNEKDQIRISVKMQNMDPNADTNMNVSMKETSKEDFLNENTVLSTDEIPSNTTGFAFVNNESKTQRNSVIDPKRSSLPINSEANQFIAKSLMHGEIKKRPVANNILGPNNNIGQHNQCEEFNFSNEIAVEIPIHNNNNANSININNQNKNQNQVNNLLANGGINSSSTPVSNNANKVNFKSLLGGITINNSNNNSNLTYSFNLENISISKEQPPKFTNEEYRRMFTRLIRKDLGRSFINNLFLEEEQMEDFLASHKVTERMRVRMIDWMIEVLTNYKCDDNTFFIAVNTMDRFFKAYDTAIQPGELHLIGVAAMFMASKYEDIYPLRLRIVHEKIAHKKLSCQEIKEKETDISVKLGFVLGKPSQWDFINYFIEEIFFTQINNFAVQDKTLWENYGSSMGSVSPNLLQNFSQYEAEVFKNYTPNMINLLRHVVVYLAKMNCHDYLLCMKKPSLLAASTIFVAMKICEQINKEEYVNEYFSRKLTEISQKNENDIIKTAQKILYNAQNFDTIFNGLENLKKIHFNAIIDLKNTK